jgi:predicted nucleic acid-binding protein
VNDLVIDASAGADLLLNTANAKPLLSKLPARAQWWVPEHYLLEAASVLRRAELNGRSTPARIAHAYHRLTTAEVHRVQIRPLMDLAWSRRGHLTVADALYVALAEQIGATLVTSDLKLARSPGLQVPTITP